MPLGTEVGIGPGNYVLNEDPAPLHEKGTTAPQLFGLCPLWPNGSHSQQVLSSCNNTATSKL